MMGRRKEPPLPPEGGDSLELERFATEYMRFAEKYPTMMALLVEEARAGRIPAEQWATIDAAQRRVADLSAEVQAGIRSWRATGRRPAGLRESFMSMAETIMRIMVASSEHTRDFVLDGLRRQQAALDMLGVAFGVRRPRSGGPKSVEEKDRALHAEWVKAIIAAGGDFDSSSTRSKANRVLEHQYSLKPETLRKKLRKGRDACDSQSCPDPKHRRA